MAKVKVFVSHSTADDKKMEAVTRAIKKRAQLEPVVVVKKRQQGKWFPDKVAEAIDSADLVIPILTSNSIMSQWVNQEIGYARAKGKDIWPVLAKNQTQNLKGFLSRDQDQAYRFESSTNDRQEALLFARVCKKLLDDYLTEKKLNELPSKAEHVDRLEKLILMGFKAHDVEVEHTLKSNTSFQLKVKLADKEQAFRAYFRFVTDNGERKWVGFNNVPGDKYVTADENSQSLEMPPKTFYQVETNVLKTIASRFQTLKGSPVMIDRVRFRADKTKEQPITFYYGFTN
jgi:hypothetical protein